MIDDEATSCWEQLSQISWHSGLVATSLANSQPSITSLLASVHLILNNHYSAVPHQDRAEFEREPTVKSLYWENTQICNEEERETTLFIIISQKFVNKDFQDCMKQIPSYCILFIYGLFNDTR
jgi:hypothetical protein